MDPTGVGKNTLLASLTNAKPQILGRRFTTTESTPGMMQFEDVQIQLVETPALMEGANEGVGWGPRILSLARNGDGLILMVDLSDDSLAQLDMMVDELRAVHIEVVERGEKVEVQDRENGGVQKIPFSGFSGDFEEIREALRGRGIYHALVKVGGQVAAEDVLSFLGHPMLHKPTHVVANKAESPGAEDKLKDLKQEFPELQVISTSLLREKGVEKLPRLVFDSLGIMRVYTKRAGQEPSTRPIIVKTDSNVLDVTRIIHKEFYEEFTFAKVWAQADMTVRKLGVVTSSVTETSLRSMPRALPSASAASASPHQEAKKSLWKRQVHVKEH